MSQKRTRYKIYEDKTKERRTYEIMNVYSGRTICFCYDRDSAIAVCKLLNEGMK